MNDNNAINSAIESYDDWSHPGYFFSTVRSTLTTDQLAIIDNIWNDVTMSSKWSSNKLLDAAQMIRAEIKGRHPFLTTSALLPVDFRVDGL